MGTPISHEVPIKWRHVMMSLLQNLKMIIYMYHHILLDVSGHAQQYEFITTNQNMLRKTKIQKNYLKPPFCMNRKELKMH